METPVDLIETLFESGETYGKTNYELAKLKALEATTLVASALIARISTVVAFSLFVLVLTIGIALLLGDWLGKPYYGFLILSGFYLLTGLVLHAFLYNWIKKPVSDLIITQVLE